jgi:ABC-type transport system involved in multi-copper enzyme maturation permease subunit
MRRGEALVKLIKKDLILNKKLLLINAILLLACLCYFAAASTQTPPKVFAGFAGLMMAMIPSSLITQEDKFKAMTLGCSLPVSRKAIVEARFLLSLALAVGGLLTAFLFGVLVPFSAYAFADLFSSGLLIVLVVMQVWGIVLFTIARLARAAPDLRIIDSVRRFFSRLHASLGPLGFNLAMVGCLLLLLFASYRISLWIFKRREF